MRVSLLLGFAAVGCLDRERETDPMDETVPYPEVLVVPELVHFGGLARGEVAVKTVTVWPQGAAPLTLQGFSIVGSGAFALADDPGSQVLDPEDGLDLVVAFSPTTRWNDGDLVFQIDPAGLLYELGLSGEGLVPDHDDVPPWPEAYDGQFIQMDVVSIDAR